MPSFMLMVTIPTEHEEMRLFKEYVRKRFWINLEDVLNTMNYPNIDLDKIEPPEIFHQKRSDDHCINNESKQKNQTRKNKKPRKNSNKLKRKKIKLIKVKGTEKPAKSNHNIEKRGLLHNSRKLNTSTIFPKATSEVYLRHTDLEEMGVPSQQANKRAKKTIHKNFKYEKRTKSNKNIQKRSSLHNLRRRNNSVKYKTACTDPDFENDDIRRQNKKAQFLYMEDTQLKEIAGTSKQISANKIATIPEETPQHIENHNFTNHTEKVINEDPVNPFSLRLVQYFFKNIINFLFLRIRQAKNTKRIDYYALDLPPCTSLVDIMKALIKKHDLKKAQWNLSADGRYYQITFVLAVSLIYESVLKRLHEWGIGEREGSNLAVVNVVESELFKKKKYLTKEEQSHPKPGCWEKFVDSMFSRINVVQTVNETTSKSRITFSYVLLVLCAAFIATVGFLENSMIYLLASMLISPLMGPILTIIFGTEIHDKKLFWIGIKSEIFGMLLSLGMGFFVGIIVSHTEDRFGNGSELTSEMLARCTLRNLKLGILVALTSGAAAAIALLTGDIIAMIGVAISASLLPPAVNTGLLWSFALMHKIYENNVDNFNIVISNYTYAQTQTMELLIKGLVSLGITLTNILSIYLTGLIIVKIKEVRSVYNVKRKFWSNDMKIGHEIITFFTRSDNIAKTERIRQFYEEEEKLPKSEIADQKTWHGYIHDNFLNEYTIKNINRLYATIGTNESSKFLREMLVAWKAKNRDEVSPAYRSIFQIFALHKNPEEAKKKESEYSSKVIAVPSSTIVDIELPNSTAVSRLPMEISSSSGRCRFTVTPVDEYEV